MKTLRYILAALAILLSVNVFFEISDIQVEGNVIYSAGEITEASGLHPGLSGLAPVGPVASRRIRKALPGVTGARVSLVLPDRLVITVRETAAAAVLMTELAAHYLLKGMSLLDAMDAIYARFGWYAEKTLNAVMPGVDGVARRQETMRRLRETPPETVGGLRVTAMRDYQTGLERELATGAEKPTALKGSDVLIWLLEDGSKLAVRPSGTEPKIKLYLLLRGSSGADCAAKMAACEKDALALCE